MRYLQRAKNAHRSGVGLGSWCAPSGVDELGHVLIILDTCILGSCGLGSSTADLLRMMRELEVERIAVPWAVMEEVTAQQVVKYRQQRGAAEKAHKALAEVAGWEVPPQLEAFDPEAVRKHWREEYGSIVEVIATSQSTLREALRREANILPPCKSVTAGKETVKIGGRDAAIWLSAVEYAREHPDETVYFVSSNTKDFGHGNAYEYPMDEDLAGLEAIPVT
ncbi:MULTISPECIES: PIN domain-containing protein [unclassified Streptomyces]|uniref:PIN domain-containing protein n=1 Tax=unclassified Streptomyces TaxID=2593676 RepID=UPI002035CDEA|nr:MULTISPECIES: PIN domain-containing protein [unclassified Streptomyces]